MDKDLSLIWEKLKECKITSKIISSQPWACLIRSSIQTKSRSSTKWTCRIRWRMLQAMACQHNLAFSELWIRIYLVSPEALDKIHKIYLSLSITIREIRVVHRTVVRKMWLLERTQASNFFLQMEDHRLVRGFQTLFRWNGMIITIAQLSIEKRVLAKILEL